MLRIGYISIAIVLILSFVLPGCSNNDIEVREVVSQMINAEEGGNITITEEQSARLAGLQLHIPPGALESDQQITVGEVLGGLPAHSEDYVWLGHQISLQPDGLSFATPCTLRMVFSEEEWQAWNSTVPEENMMLMKFDESSGSWVAMPSQIHGSVLTAEIESFSFRDIVIFWGSDNPASDSKIRDQAVRWGAPESWDTDDRLQSESMFVDHSQVWISTTDITFEDKIRALLLAEAMWEKIEDGNFSEGVDLAEIVLENIAINRLKDLIAKGLGIPTLGVVVSVASVIIESSIDALVDALGAAMFDKQVKAYLSFRGWFFVKQGNQWVWIYDGDPDLAHSHKWVLANAPIWGGWLQAIQKPDGTMRSFSYFGSGVPSKAPEVVYDLGNKLCDLLHKVKEEEWVPWLHGYVNGLQADREWLYRAFTGRNKAPEVAADTLDYTEVGLEVTLEGEVTDFEDDPTMWLWTQRDGPSIALQYSSTLQPYFTPTVPGLYSFTLTAVDLLMENDNSAAAAITVVEEGEEPTPVYFPDFNLETVIREALGKETEPIYDSDMEGLISLNAQQRYIEDLTGLEHAVNLMELDLTWNVAIRDLSPITNLIDLTSLNLNFVHVRDISPLANLTSLTWLSANGAEIEDTSPLAGLTNLTYLDLESGLETNDISALSNLTSLTYLNLYNNGFISNISALANLTELTTLRLANNDISDISPLANLSSLTSLSLSDNDITDISALANLSSLWHLTLADNDVSNISHLANLSNLTYLYLGRNQVVDISPLGSLTSMTKLSLDYNEINDISPLVNLTNLTDLNLRSNQITDSCPLVENEGLGEGDTIWLEGNPLSDESLICNSQLSSRGVTVYYS